MSEKEIVRNYSNGSINVKWEPSKCIHSGICAKTLPSVFKPKDRPWVHIDAAPTKEIVKTIDQCPSGALSYQFIKNKANSSSKSENESEIQVLKDGPLLVKGGFDLELEDGSHKNVDRTTALCRCGASENKPYCDGAHTKVGFKG